MRCALPACAAAGPAAMLCQGLGADVAELADAPDSKFDFSMF